MSTQFYTALLLWCSYNLVAFGSVVLGIEQHPDLFCRMCRDSFIILASPYTRWLFLIGGVAVNWGRITSLKQVCGRELWWPKSGEDRLGWWVAWPCISCISLFLESCDGKRGRTGVFSLLWIVYVLRNTKAPQSSLSNPFVEPQDPMARSHPRPVQLETLELRHGRQHLLKLPPFPLCGQGEEPRDL